MGLVSNVVLVVVFAWVVRGLLDARQVTWPRLLLAVVAGTVVGATVAALMVIDVTVPIQEQVALFEARRSEVYALALPLQVVATMLAVVVLELLWARQPGGGGGWRRPIRSTRRALGVAARGWQVLRIVTRHGLAPALGLRRGTVDARSPEELARRARVALEDAGGMFVKLGQLLAARSDVLPAVAVEELARLHATARPLRRDEIEQALADELGTPIASVFAEVDWTPLGSASIAQVHVGRLHDGREVVVKVRRPGLLEDVERDLAVAVWLARTAQRRTLWGRTMQVGALAEDFARGLRAELDFRVEGRHAREVARGVGKVDGVRAPEVFDEWTTERLLVMERLVGQPLSAQRVDGLTAEHRRRLADLLCTSQVQAMLRGERFHGDPHPGNVMLLDDGSLGLIDFGATGRLDAFERTSVFQMLVALRLGEPALLYESLVAIGAVPTSREPDEIERRLARFMAVHLGPELPPTEALGDLVRVVADLGVRLPAQTSAMFRALATLAGTLELLSPSYPLIDVVAQLGGAELRERTSPDSLGEFVQGEWAQLAPLLRRAPRHLDRIATQLVHGGLTTRTRLWSEPEDVAVVERLLNRIIITVLGLGVGLIAVLMLGSDAGPVLAGSEMPLLHLLGWFGLFSASVLVLRVLLDVLRPTDHP